jgi:hypothetical protein
MRAASYCNSTWLLVTHSRQRDPHLRFTSSGLSSVSPDTERPAAITTFVIKLKWKLHYVPSARVLFDFIVGVSPSIRTLESTEISNRNPAQSATEQNKLSRRVNGEL